MFKKSTVNRYLQQWGYDRETLRRQPAAVRFQAEHSNDCWQFDLSPSDLKEVKEPLWLQANKGAPTLMLFREVLQLCSHPVVGWQNAPGIFGLWSIQVATIWVVLQLWS